MPLEQLQQESPLAAHQLDAGGGEQDLDEITDLGSTHPLANEICISTFIFALHRRFGRGAD